MSERDDIERKLTAALRDLAEARERVLALRRQMTGEPVQDYALSNWEGGVRLSELFGEKSDLILVHNMGTGCPYCTMWADGFNGVLPHLESRAAFAVVSPDDPAVQQAFARQRGWRFRMYSAAGTGLFADLGFASPEEHFGSAAMPGVSVLRKDADGSITRISRDEFGPGDPYCGVWHFFDLLHDGPGDWQPQFEY